MITSPQQEQLEHSHLSEIEKASRSDLMRDILYKIITLAKVDSTVIIIGEIGSGKKRLANIIHEHSNRADAPFYSFYCVDVDETDYKNAFWGHIHFDENQITLKYDALEKARGGVLYLDQFSELSPTFMQNIIDSYIKGTKQLFRYDNKSKPRLILSLNQESYQQITLTSIWQNILQRLNPMVIMLPPLRERKEDIPLLINHFLNKLKNKRKEWRNLTISSQALRECFNYDWPGNVRQLKNALLQGAVLSYGKTIECRHLPFSMNWQLPYELELKL